MQNSREFLNFLTVVCKKKKKKSEYVIKQMYKNVLFEDLLGAGLCDRCWRFSSEQVAEGVFPR